MNLLPRQILAAAVLVTLLTTASGEAPAEALEPAAQSAFMNALLRSDLPAVRALLVARPTLLTQVDRFGFTVLHLSATEEQIKIQAFLIEAGARVNAPSNDGSTPLHLAANPKFAELLVRHGADINAKAKNGDTPLHSMASEADKTDVVEALVRLGASRALKNNAGRTAFDIARDRHDREKMEILSRQRP